MKLDFAPAILGIFCAEVFFLLCSINNFKFWNPDFYSDKPEASKEIIENNADNIVVSQELVDLDCFPRNVTYKTKLKIPNREATRYISDEPEEFYCGNFKFKVTSFNEHYSNVFLGGTFIESKALKDYGCKNDLDRILCYEEMVVNHGKVAGVRSFRSFSATFLWSN
jgi:hypothetical protein